MSVQFIDFSQQYQTIKDEIDTGLKNVFENGNFILGQEEKDFEADFAQYCDVKYAVGVNSGTDALYIALSALNIGVGDEVIIPSFTFVATALCSNFCEFANKVGLTVGWDVVSRPDDASAVERRARSKLHHWHAAN